MMKPGRIKQHSGEAKRAWDERILAAKEVATNGGNLRDVARVWGVSAAWVTMTLPAMAPDVHADLLAGYRRTSLSPDEARVRLEAILDANGNIAAAARALGVKRHTLHSWMRRNFPDGLESGLEDYLEEAA